MIKATLMLGLPIAVALATKLTLVFSTGLSLENQMYLSGVNHGAVFWLMAGMLMMALETRKETAP